MCYHINQICFNKVLKSIFITLLYYLITLFKLTVISCFTSSHLHIINRIDIMRIWHAVRGEGFELGTLARTQSRLGQK